ncbi:hypothetical protein ADK43_35010 [Streptomyces rimosus subsp. rimosus]|nr:hypothetical protein ADK43_35010 [Streptomyces rimosus subsp. rimosus]
MYAVQRLDLLSLDSDGAHLMRELLVRRAAVMDRHSELPIPVDAPAALVASLADGVVTAAQYARALIAYDREHGTTRGPVPVDAACWEEHPLGYARQEHAAWVLEHEVP